MASRKQPTTMTNFPDDLLCNNIFIRLSAKQLAQMKSLSKRLNASLSHPDFIKSHVNHSIHNKVEILMVFYSLFSFRDKEFTAHPTKSPHLEVSNIFKLPANTSSKHTFCRVLGSVNGLICFSYRPHPTHVINIWNPSLSALIALPPYSIPDCSHTLQFRFGYDPKTDDYKVVKLACYVGVPRFSENRGFHVPKEWQQVEVYSMKKGSWELITNTFPSHVTMIYNEDQVCVDGHDGRLHWIGYMYDKMKLQTILTFEFVRGDFQSDMSSRCYTRV
uniref:F-box protein CPR1-like n=1 Tax=Erigeron canadensis TaxID=72917 RepID=UPI001CB99972|nr:F-box protein CPR1-like [Erigeron canadensis]